MELDINMLLLSCEILPALFFKHPCYIYTPHMEIYTFINGKHWVKKIFGIGFKGKEEKN